MGPAFNVDDVFWLLALKSSGRSLWFLARSIFIVFLPGVSGLPGTKRVLDFSVEHLHVIVTLSPCLAAC